MGYKLKSALIVSLAINLLLLGMLGGYFARGCRAPGALPPLPPGMGGKLSPESEKTFRQALKNLHEENRQTGEAIAQAQREVLQILSAPSFDATLYKKKVEELHILHGKMREKLTQTVTELAATMNQEERRALAMFLEQGPPGGPPSPPRGPHPPGFPPPPPGAPPPMGPGSR